MNRTAVVALGGNAFTRSSQAGTYEEQLANAETMAVAIRGVIDAGWRVVIVHGNGPQVGNLAVQQEATTLVPMQPLALLDAMTEGALGSIITLAVDAHCGAGAAVSVVTHVVVDASDPAFSEPTKPIGPFFDAEQAGKVARARHWTMREDAGRGYRRVVASPAPQRIVEERAINTLVAAGHIVVAAGGGGIPLVPDGDGYRVVDAVIDKDHAAQLLATGIGAQALLLVTAVQNVWLDYGTPRERPLRQISAAEAQRYYDSGHFPPGSMGPKMEAVLEFLSGGGELGMITTADQLTATLSGDGPGTRIVAEPSSTSAVSRHRA